MDNNNEINKNSGDNEVVRKRNRNKKIECKVCFKGMQSNHLKRHMKQHGDLLLMDEEDARLELNVRRQVYEDKETKQLKLDAIAHEVVETREFFEDDMKLHGLKPLITIDYEHVERRLLVSQKEYNEKLALGGIVYEIVGKGVVKVDAISKQEKDALET